MPRTLQWLLGLLIVAMLIGAPWGYAEYRQANFRNFRTVQDGVLYRSGQLSMNGFKRVVHDHGIRTVITLRDASRPGEMPPDVAEENFCLLQDINHHRLPPRLWLGPDETVPAADNVRRFLEIIDDPKNHPVLIHCYAGSHRTGAYCAIYRMEYQRWSSADAIAEVKELGYANLHKEEDVLGYLERYQPRWKASDSSGKHR